MWCGVIPYLCVSYARVDVNMEKTTKDHGKRGHGARQQIDISETKSLDCDVICCDVM